jgi:hypothetical protein
MSNNQTLEVLAAEQLLRTEQAQLVQEVSHEVRKAPARLKDSLAAAPAKVTQDAATAPANPELPPPWATYNPTGGKSQVSLMAIIQYVYTLQLQNSSRLRATWWKQSFESMTMQVKFAPIIGQAIINAANDEANALYAQAAQSEGDGRTQFIAFSGALLGGALMEYRQPTEGATNSIKSGITAEGEGGEELNSEITKKATNALGVDTKALNEAAEEEVNNGESKSWGGRAKRIGRLLVSKYETLNGKVVPWLTKSMNMAQAGQQLSNGINGWFIDAPHQREQAYYKGQEGQQQALSKEGEAFQQYWNQSNGRETELGQGAQQFIDSLVNSWQSMSNRITDANARLFSA